MRLLLLIYFSLSIIKLSFAQDNVSWFINPAEGYEYQQLNHNDYYLVSKGGQQFFKHKDGNIYPAPPSKPRALNQYWKFKSKGLTGLWSPKKGEIIPPIYEDIFHLSDSTFYVYKYGMYALINIKNELIIPYENYTLIKPIGKNLLKTRQGKKHKLFNVHGDTIPLNGGSALAYYPSGLFKMFFGEGFNMMDENSNLLFDELYEEVKVIHDKFIYVRNNGKKGLYDLKGKEILPIQFEDFRFIFVDGKHQAYVIKENGQYGILTLDGQKKRMGEFDKIVCFDRSPNSYLLVESDNKLGCLNPLTLDWDIPPIYDKQEHRAFRCYNPVYFASTDTGNVLMNLEKNISIPIKTTTLYNFKHGFTKVQLERRKNWALINKEGEFVTDYIFSIIKAKEFPVYSAVDNKKQRVLVFPDGTIKVVPENIKKIQPEAREGLVIFQDSKNKFGFMNEKCEIIIPAVFDNAKKFINGLAEVRYQGKWGIIKHPISAD
jgi:hypothetical protein